MDVIFEFLSSPIAIAVVLGLIVIWFLKSSNKAHSCWKERGIPYVEPTPFFGSLLGNLKKPLHETELERYRKYGPVYGHFEGNNALLSVGDPKLLRDILVKDFHVFTNHRPLKTGDTVTECMLQILQGEDWKRVRSIVTPTFTTGKIKRMLGIFTSCSKVLVKNFREYAEKGEPLEARKIYSAFTMDIIASAAFSTKIDSLNDENNEFVQNARNVFKKEINYRYVFYLLFPRLMKFFRIPVFPPERVKFFTTITLQIMEERKRTGQTRNDFLQLLMDTAKEQSEQEKNAAPEITDDILGNYGGESNDQVFKNYQPSKKTLSFNELVAQCVIFFIAGYETTATTMAFATYYLALNPEIQDKLVEELDTTIKECDGKLTYEGVQSMKYLDNVISETLRLNSPASRLDRIASEDYKLGDTGYIIPKGTIITVPTNAIHRDDKYFPNAEKFDPDRFTPEERAKRDAYTYMPFGIGPRGCVAMRFALVEMKVCLAYVLSHFRIKRCPQTKVPLEYYISQATVKPKDIMVQMELRKDCPLKE